MAIQELTKAEIQLLEELTAAGERGRTIAGSGAEIAHLMRAQYIKRLRGMKLYVIALAEAAAGQR